MGAQHGIDLAIGHKGGELVLHVFQRHMMMFAVIGIDALGSQDERPIPLVGVDCGGSDTCVGIDSGKDQSVRPQVLEFFIKICAEESTVSFLDHDDI